MSNLPALIKAPRGERYHIAIEGNSSTAFRTRCGRTINAFEERHALHLENTEICPRCGSMADYEAINEQRCIEEEERTAEHKRILEANRVSLEAHNAVRPALVDEIETRLTYLTSDQDRSFDRETHLNMDALRFLTTLDGQQFTVKIEIWNGKH